jgi:acetyl esterase/lipase
VRHIILKNHKLRFILPVIFTVIIAATAFICYMESKPKTFDALISKIGYYDEEDRQIYRGLIREWKFPDGYEIEKTTISGREADWIYATGINTDKVIIQLHGGAYRKSLKDKRKVCERYAVKMAEISGAKVLTIDYRIAPANPYPAALEDSVSAYQWLLDNGYKAENIIITGDSAGGGLALATGLFLRDHNMTMPAAFITMSAWTDLNYRQIKIPYVGDNAATNPYISPAYGDYNDFPPMLLQAGADEYILGDTTMVAKKAEEAGVKVKLDIYDDMEHVFQQMYPTVESANEAWEEVKTFIEGIYETNKS